MTQLETIIEALRAAHTLFSEEQKKAAKAYPEDRAELHAETTGHNIMMHEAIKIIKEHLA